MQFIERNQIKSDKWDKRIANDPLENIFCYSWYLDAVADNWGALVSENYQTILPVPYSKKMGIKQMYQPPFTRELDIFGNDFNWQEALDYLESQFKSIQFRNNKNHLIPNNLDARKHQVLDINDGQLKYSTNAKRLIKKASKNFSIDKGVNPRELIELFKNTAWKKVKSISDKDLDKLRILMKNALDLNQGELFQIRDNNKMIAAGFFLKDKKRITYLKGSATEDAKKKGAIYGIINHAIEKYRSEYKVLDFGGSDVDSVATFYKKFGAIDRTYYNYEINNLPAWYKTLKRIKR